MTNDSKLIRNSVICLRALGMTSSLHFCKAAHSTSRYNIPHPAPPMSPKTAPLCVVKRAQLHRDSPSPQSLRLSLASDLDPGASWVQMTSINQSLKGTQNSKCDENSRNTGGYIPVLRLSCTMRSGSRMLSNFFSTAVFYNLQYFGMWMLLFVLAVGNSQ